jgi:hypothetical protein
VSSLLPFLPPACSTHHSRRSCVLP